MDSIEKPRVLVIMIGALVLLNLATLGFLWFRKPPMPPGHRGEAAAEYLIAEVGLTPDQAADYKLLIQEHQANMRSINDSVRYHKILLFNNININDSTVTSMEASAVARLQAQLELNTFNHFVKVRALCSPVQALKFDKVIGDVLQMMAPPGPPGKR